MSEGGKAEKVHRVVFELGVFGIYGTVLAVGDRCVVHVRGGGIDWGGCRWS